MFVFLMVYKTAYNYKVNFGANVLLPNCLLPHAPRHKGGHAMLFLLVIFTVLILYTPAFVFGSMGE